MIWTFTPDMVSSISIDAQNRCGCNARFPTKESDKHHDEDCTNPWFNRPDFGPFFRGKKFNKLNDSLRKHQSCRPQIALPDRGSFIVYWPRLNKKCSMGFQQCDTSSYWLIILKYRKLLPRAIKVCPHFMQAERRTLRTGWIFTRLPQSAPWRSRLIPTTAKEDVGARWQNGLRNLAPWRQWSCVPTVTKAPAIEEWLQQS